MGESICSFVCDERPLHPIVIAISSAAVEQHSWCTVVVVVVVILIVLGMFINSNIQNLIDSMGRCVESQLQNHDKQ